MTPRSVLRRWVAQRDQAEPVDADPQEAHRRRRNRRAAASTLAALGARGVVLAGSLISIPVSIGYLGAERFGVFVALTSLTTMLVFADLGLGNGVLTVVSDADGRDDREAARRSVSSAFFTLTCMAALTGIIFLVVYPSVDWPRLLNVSSALASREVGPTAAVMIGLFLLAMPLGLTERVRLAYQEGYVNSLAAALGTVMGLVGLFAAVAAKAALPLLVLAMSAPLTFALGLNALRLFTRDRRWLRPRLAWASRLDALRLARVGALYLVLQVAVVVAFQSDVLIATALLGPEAAATYSVTMRVFMFAPSLVGAFLLTLWPAYAEALARKDAVWVKQTLVRSITLAAGVVLVASVGLLIAGIWVVDLLSAGEIHPPMALMVGAAAWAITSSCFNAIAMLMNAASIVRFQAITAVIMAIGSIALSIVFAGWFGVSGIVWGTLIAYLVFSAIPIALYMPRLLRRLEEGTLGVSASVH